jgi:UDP-4-amino-4,6-dideoxy-N-acetyl-beta-L-altrosamine transaminase
MRKIPYGKQHITKDDIQAVVDALQSDFLTQGPKIKEFEDAFANYVDAKYAVAVSNGTAALHLSALALGVKKGDFVICTPLTFVASVNCIKYCGGEVIFADIDPITYLIDLNQVSKILEKNQEKNIVGIIPVDFAGSVVDTEKLKEIASKHNCWILEDACHAPGGFFQDSNSKNIKAGSCKFADLAIFSFHPVKHIACGEGGMITTQNEALYKKLLLLRTHGITRETDLFQNKFEEVTDNPNSFSDYPSWYMEMQELGYNYRLTDFQAALGLSQLKRAENGISRRRDIAKKYTSELSNCEGIIGFSGNVSGHAYHLFIIEAKNRRHLFEHLKSEGIFCQIHYIPVHFMPYYQSLGSKKDDLPKVANYYQNCLSLPMFPTLTDAEQNEVINVILKFYEQYANK